MKGYLLPLVLLLLGILASLGTWFLMDGQKTALRTDLEEQLATQRKILFQFQTEYAAEKATLEQTIAQLTTTTNDLTEERADLQESLAQAQNTVTDIKKQVGDAIQTVGTLDKLSKIDPKLLEKYSKVAFLNENYTPSKLAIIESRYAYDESREHKLQAQVMPFFVDMENDALDDGVKLFVSSAYRSFGEQGTLKNAYSVSYGSGANAFSADQGYSEHQLGSTVDFTTTGINGGLDGFDKTAAYTWLTKNAYKYGFVLSYPPGNQYYVFEPWHWRFVGTSLSKYLHTQKKNFYDLDQRTISTYLISIFD